jgi:hypothetical protein
MLRTTCLPILITFIRGACKQQWNLGEFVTIDETMVRYKGTYCLARQYMPKKPVKWGVKVWCTADSKSKFIYDFDIYYGKTQATLESRASTTEEQNLVHRVITQLLKLLLKNWGTRNYKGSLELPRHPKIHCPRYTTFRRKCVHCRTQCNYYFYLCGWRWMCVKKGCYELEHTPLRTPPHHL